MNILNKIRSKALANYTKWLRNNGYYIARERRTESGFRFTEMLIPELALKEYEVWKETGKHDE